LTLYKISQRLLGALERGTRSSGGQPFAGIVFDCDGVLIDAKDSYDLALEVSASAFASLLGLKFSTDQLRNALEALRRLGTFNNDWDSLAVIVAYLFARSSSRETILSLSTLTPISSRLRYFESKVLEAMGKEEDSSITSESLSIPLSSELYPSSTTSSSNRIIDLAELATVVEESQLGSRRDALISKLIPDAMLLDQFYRSISYPAPVGESLLATFFDEAMYGTNVFRSTYGFECATSTFSKPGLINNEKLIIKPMTLESLSQLCSNNLGIITGRPRVPTIHTLGSLFGKYFTNPSLCLFTGDYLLNSEEVKPSPKPMLRVASALVNGQPQSLQSPILYVGDSGEDMLMVKRANEIAGTAEMSVLFAAIAEDRQKAEFFRSQGDAVDCIVSNVNELSRALLSNQIRNSAQQ